MQKQLILASSSPFRRQLLDRLHLDYDCHSPSVDETALDGESAHDYVCRLALAKAQNLAEKFPQAVVIGSDQCALLQDQILGKPGGHQQAMRQLRAAQGKNVVFHTGVCVLQQSRNFKAVEDVLYEVEFRQLTDVQLDHYLRVEQPYQCAGSFKAEGYGACLFKRQRGDDPSAIIGLPLLTLIPMLETAGIRIV